MPSIKKLLRHLPIYMILIFSAIYAQGQNWKKSQKKGKIKVNVGIEIGAETTVRNSNNNNSEHLAISAQQDSTLHSATSNARIDFHSLITELTLTPAGNFYLDQFKVIQPIENNEPANSLKIVKVKLIKLNPDELVSESIYQLEEYNNQLLKASLNSGDQNKTILRQGKYKIEFELSGYIFDHFKFEVTKEQSSLSTDLLFIKDDWSQYGWLWWSKNSKGKKLLYFNTLIGNKSKTLKSHSYIEATQRAQYLITLQKEIKSDSFQIIAYNKISAAKNEPLYRSVSIKRGEFISLETTFIDFPRVQDTGTETFEITQEEDIKDGSYRIILEYKFPNEEDIRKVFCFDVHNKEINESEAMIEKITSQNIALESGKILLINEAK